MGVFRIVEHQQPVTPSSQLSQQRGDDLGLLGLLGDAQLARQGDQVAGDGGGLLGRDPPADPIVAGVPVDVLGGELGLADPAKPVQHPRRTRLRLAGLAASRRGVLVGEGGDSDRCSGCGELLVEAVKQPVAASERRVMRRQLDDRPSSGDWAGSDRGRAEWTRGGDGGDVDIPAGGWPLGAGDGHVAAGGRAAFGGVDGVGAAGVVLGSWRQPATPPAPRRQPAG
jgi:hypothetical protein